ncbi:uncharacterized protein LOC105940357 isoform X2 [Fundulus heteroclitus]|uniref:uncharacterized protein LOC105940357 isoform X2 n=1 Tax=Fundulus heteroclitus TaxID=8078 RepID=UPI00165C0F26|nr:uncharacterized protein LOC105940357 isoform X2 [Fundulus heteroclitus]
MLTMKADKGILFFALWLISVSSNGEEVCKKHEVTALLGSSALLSCNFSSNDDKLVTWTQRDQGDEQDLNLVQLWPNGRIKFLDPRDGRVKIFPIQVLGGNYSILIDGLQLSDMGSYNCRGGNECYEVKLSEDKGTLSPATQLLIFMCAGFAALMLLSLFGYLCWLKCTCFENKSRPNGAIITVSERIEGPSAPPQEVDGVNGPQIGLNYGLVYENDDQYVNPIGNPGGQPGVQQHQDGNQPYHSGIGIYPNLEEFKFERAESQRTKQRFHIELMNRLRQASFNRHFYANQGEIRKQQAKAAQTERKRAGVGRRKANDSCEYKNPIYNRSTDHLDRL